MIHNIYKGYITLKTNEKADYSKYTTIDIPTYIAILQYDVVL